MELSLGEVAQVLGTSVATPDRIARGYSIDSRTLAEGELFFAIRGRRFDGHTFVSQAFARRAAGAIVGDDFFRASPDPLRPFLLPVADTTRALQQLGQTVRKKWGKPLVAVTGSAGKSTTKEMTAAILGRRYSVLKSQGNLNNQFGLPLTLLSIEAKHDVVVAELAMSAAGEIALLATLAAPDIGVVTNVAAVHLEFFDSVDSIALAKKELIDHLPAGATAVLNFDDPRVRAFGASFAGKVVTFGFDAGADVRAVEIRADASRGCRFRVQSPTLQGEIHVPLPGRHNVQNALAAIAAASLLGASAEDARQAMENFQPLAQRSEILTLASGVVLVSDCYNSNPLAMEKMLETLANWPGAKRRVVVAGEMLELGPGSPDLHRAVGRKCPESGVEWVIAVQGDARFLAEGAEQAGLPAGRAKFFQTPEEAAEFSSAILLPGDVVLVKGSRAVRLEKVVEFLRSFDTRPKGGHSTPSRA
jgi:UDP-N-acetylmuramoyl-tripeptide--D-alanyl-D-alanine ligase